MSKQGHSEEQIERKLDAIQTYKTYQSDLLAKKQTLIAWRNSVQDDRTKVYLKSKVQLLDNNFDIASNQIQIMECELLVDKLRKDNYRIKLGYGNELVQDIE